MNTLVYMRKRVFLGDTNELNRFLRKQPGSSKQTVVCDVSILHSLTYHYLAKSG